MSHVKTQNAARCLPLIAGALAVTSCLGCGSGDAHVVAIAGTEAVTLSRSNWSISVSPDERWLVFWELREEDGDPYDAHLCTLNLKTSSKTSYGIHDVYTELSSLSHVEPWEKIGLSFRDACWVDGRCSVKLLFRGSQKTLVFEPGVVEARFSTAPLDPACSDCPPAGLVESLTVELVGRWLLSYGTRYSVAYKDGRIKQSIYHLDPRCDDVCIVKTDSSGSQIVIQYPRRKFHNIALITLRVSPDERYLAYGLLSELRAPIPLPDQEVKLHVYDLVEEMDHTISSGYRYMSNIIWSPDSKRLYFAGIQGTNRAVYRFDVDKNMPE